MLFIRLTLFSVSLKFKIMNKKIILLTIYECLDLEICVHTPRGGTRRNPLPWRDAEGRAASSLADGRKANHNATWSNGGEIVNNMMCAVMYGADKGDDWQKLVTHRCYYVWMKISIVIKQSVFHCTLAGLFWISCQLQYHEWKALIMYIGLLWDKYFLLTARL